MTELLFADRTGMTVGEKIHRIRLKQHDVFVAGAGLTPIVIKAVARFDEILKTIHEKKIDMAVEL